MSKVSKDATKHRKLWLAITAVAILLIATAVIGRMQQTKITDGTEKYSGAQLEAAKSAMERLRMEDDLNPANFGDVYRVDAVRVARPDEASCAVYLRYSNDPNSKAHYAIEVSSRTLFGIKTTSRTLYGCSQQLNP